MKYLSQLILTLLPLLLVSPMLFATDKELILEEEKARPVVAQDDCD